MAISNVVELILRAKSDTKDLDQIKTALSQVKQGLKEAADGGTQDFKVLAGQVKAIEAELQRIDQAAKHTEATFKQAFKAIDSTISGTAQFLTDFKTLMVGAGISLAVTKSLQAAADYQSALVDMGKVTTRAWADIDKEIKALPVELGHTTALMQGYYQVMSAGVTKPVEAMDLLVVASKGAKAGHVEQAEVIKALTKLMTGFSGEIKSATEASDLLFSIEQYGQTTYRELVPIIGEVASISKQARVRSNELGAALSYITQTAGTTSEAATQYKAILMGLLKPQEEMTRALTALGFSSGEALVQQRGLAGAIQSLAEYARSAGVPLTKLFESHEALLALGPLLQTQFRTYYEYLDGMQGKAGKTETAFQNWRGTFNAVKETFGNTVGKALIELGEKLMPSVQSVLKDFGDWITNNKGDIVVFFQTLGDLTRDFRDTLADAIGFWGPKLRWVVDLVSGAGSAGARGAVTERARLGGLDKARQLKADEEVDFDNWKRNITGRAPADNFNKLLGAVSPTASFLNQARKMIVPEDIFDKPEQYLIAGLYWRSIAEQVIARRKTIQALDDEIKELERQGKRQDASGSKSGAPAPTPLGNKDASAGHGAPAAMGIQLPEEVLKYRAIILEMADKYNMDPRLIAAIILTESHGNPRAISTKGAMGLMQLMPETAAGLGVTDAFDPHANVEGGVKYFRSLLERYAGDVMKAVAAYNWGPGNVDKDPSLKTAPKETQEFLKKVFGGATKIGWSADTVPIDWEHSLDQQHRLWDAQLRTIMSRAQETADLELAKLKGLYEKGQVALTEYFDDRRAIIEKKYAEEIQALRRLQAAEGDPAKRFELGEQIDRLGMRKQRELELNEHEREKERENLATKQAEIDHILQEAKRRITQYEPGDQESKQYQKELSDLDNYYEQKIARLRKYNADQAAINQEYDNWERERKLLKEDQERRHMETQLTIAAQVAGGMQGVFSDLYILTGKHNRELLIAAKAAGVAQVIIQTEMAIMKALAEMGPIAGPVMAGVIAAKGAISIATILAQGYASGGLVAGSSPSPTADNIPARLTAGEYVLPVAAVQHYGVGIMEAMRRRLVPPEILAGWRRPVLPELNPTPAYASGGMVKEVRGGQDTQSLQATIVNVFDHQDFLNIMASHQGGTVMWNWMSTNAPRIRRLLSDL